MIQKWIFVALIGTFFSFTVAQAQTPATDSKKKTEATAPSLSSDAQSAKVLLEEIIVRRFSQDLGTRVPKDSYSMSAQLDVAKLEMEDIPAQEPMTDLMLGLLEPDELVKRVASEAGAKETLVNFLSQYTIKKVSVSVGLDKKEITEEKKAEITTWLSNRLKQEFGGSATSLVNFIEKIPEPVVPEKQKTFVDNLKELQDFAGQAVIALALIIGSLLWGIFARTKSTRESIMNSKEAQAAQAQALQAQENKDRTLALERRKNETDVLRKEINETTQKILDLVPRTSEYFESVLRNWVNLGEAGRFRLVCFAEAIRQDLGKLPIPVDAVEDVKRVFAQMPNVQLKEKRDALDKAYWDLLAVLNLGSDALTEPFSYLGGVNVDSVQNVLMEKNSKMRTIVALYMPDDMRSEYVRSLSEEDKRELLVSAAEMQAISSKEFKTLDRQLGMQLQGTSGTGDEMMRLEMTLQKIISSFSQVEQIMYLRGMPKESLAVYKSTTPSLAFLDEWPDDALDRLINGITTDEIVNYIQIVPSMKEKLLSICRPMTAQMVKDELSRNVSLNETEQNRLLENTLERLQILAEEKIIDVQRIFPAPDARPKLYVA